MNMIYFHLGWILWNWQAGRDRLHTFISNQAFSQLVIICCNDTEWVFGKNLLYLICLLQVELEIWCQQFHHKSTYPQYWASKIVFVRLLQDSVLVVYHQGITCLQLFGIVNFAANFFNSSFHVGASPFETAFEKPVPVNRQSLLVAAAYANSTYSLITYSIYL